MFVSYSINNFDMSIKITIESRVELPNNSAITNIDNINIIPNMISS